MIDKPQLIEEGTKHVLAAASIGVVIVEWLPLLFAIPGVVYYLVLLVEKFTGQAAKDWFKREKS